MNRRTLISLITMLVILLLGSFMTTSCGSGQEETVAPPSEQDAPPTLDGQSLVQERCAECHGLGQVTGAQKTEEEWRTTVERMVGKGANLNSAEQEAVIQFLTETYPK
jgi:mono/diheme cytochrome c family protein